MARLLARLFNQFYDIASAHSLSFSRIELRALSPALSFHSLPIFIAHFYRFPFAFLSISPLILYGDKRNETSFLRPKRSFVETAKILAARAQETATSDSNIPKPLDIGNVTQYITI